MKLYGTTTSPYVRRVRIVAEVLSLDYNLINTATEDGQVQLRKVSPLWKVPTLVHQDDVLWDSHTIIDWLFETHGYGNIRSKSLENQWREMNIITAADALLDSGINLFYLKKDGLDTNDSSYLEKQAGRMAALLEWLSTQLQEPCLKLAQDFSYASIVLVSTIDWLSFRQSERLLEFDALVDYAKVLNQHKVIHETYPIG